jgi:hypothetical protein
MKPLVHVPCVMIISLLCGVSSFANGQEKKAPRPTGSCGRCEEGPPRPARLITGSGPDIFVQRGGSRQWVPNVDTLKALGFNLNQVITISDTELRNIPRDADYPSLVTNLIKGSGPAIFQLENGSRRWIPDMETFNAMGLSGKPVQALTDEQLNRIPQAKDYPSRK